MSIKKSLLFSILLAGCFFIYGGFAGASEDADVDVGCRTSESLAAFQNEAEPSLLIGADVGVVYANVLTIDNPILSHTCIVADVDAFTIGKDLGGGFSEAILMQPDGTKMLLVVSTPAMDDIDEPVVATKGELPPNAAVISKTTAAPCSIAAQATVFTIENGECQ